MLCVDKQTAELNNKTLFNLKKHFYFFYFVRVYLLSILFLCLTVTVLSLSVAYFFTTKPLTTS